MSDWTISSMRFVHEAYGSFYLAIYEHSVSVTRAWWDPTTKDYEAETLGTELPSVEVAKALVADWIRERDAQGGQGETL